jgi:AmmeMemoRadiSam system protein A
VVGYASIAFVSEAHGREAKSHGHESESGHEAHTHEAETISPEAKSHTHESKSHHDSISEADQKALLAIARGEIKSAVLGEEKFSLPDNLSPYLKEKRGCFVTLHKNGRLRGCIGTISPSQRLGECVRENAFNAAFSDPRFSPLSSDELDQVEIEISVLTLPRQIHFSNPMDLKRQLRPGRDGVILSLGYNRATYLPQVWEQLPDKESFLASLSQKAGLPKNAWKDPKIKIEVYQAMVFSAGEPSQ